MLGLATLSLSNIVIKWNITGPYLTYAISSSFLSEANSLQSLSTMLHHYEDDLWLPTDFPIDFAYGKLVGSVRNHSFSSLINPRNCLSLCWGDGETKGTVDYEVNCTSTSHTVISWWVLSIQGGTELMCWVLVLPSQTYLASRCPCCSLVLPSLPTVVKRF